jgi:hypothetical protein
MLTPTPNIKYMAIKTTDQVFFHALDTGEFIDHTVTLSDFDIYGDKHNLCPFCGDQNKVTNTFNLYQVLSSGETCSSLVFLCSQHQHIRQIYMADKAGKGLKSDITNPRLRKYVVTQELPDDASSYSTGNEYYGKCCLCKKPIDKNNLVAVPFEQGRSDVLLGWVHFCFDCHDATLDLEKQINVYPKVKGDSCAKCGDVYPVTNYEYDTRKLNGTLNKHHCNSCLHTWYDHLNRDRFVSIQCEECSDSIVVDRTMFPDMSMYTCQKHSAQIDEGLNLSYLIGDNDELELRIHGLISQTSKRQKWNYTIFDMHTEKIIAIPPKSKLWNYKTVEECAFDAAMHAEEILEARPHKQIKLL